MQKIDAGLVADVLAYCEAHADSDDEAALVHWISEHVGDAIKRTHPRFNVGEWAVRSTPIKMAALRSRILATLGGGES